MFRDEEDFLRGINALALACIYNGAKLCTFSLQSDHVHFDALTDIPSTIVKSFRRIHTMYFNRKYHRTGPLGEHSFFINEIDGIRHIEAAESYILRNAVHHGIAASPFGYPFNSSCCYFAKDLGHSFLSSIDFSKYRKGTFLPHNRRFSKDILMNPQGIIDPKHYIEISLVEKFFTSPRGFNYCMTRLSGEEWAKSQEKDQNNKEAVTIETVEMSYSDLLDQMYENEKGRKSSLLTDIEVCRLIDKRYLRKYRCRSYTELNNEQKEAILMELLPQRGFSKSQLRRCLALP